MNGAARGHQALGECDLDCHGIAAEIMTRHDMRLHAKFMDQRAEPHAQRLHAHQIELRRLSRARMAEPPARVIFAETRRLDERPHLESQGVGGEIGGWFGQHRHHPLKVCNSAEILIVAKLEKVSDIA